VTALFDGKVGEPHLDVRNALIAAEAIRRATERARTASVTLCN